MGVQVAVNIEYLVPGIKPFKFHTNKASINISFDTPECYNRYNTSIIICQSICCSLILTVFMVIFLQEANYSDLSASDFNRGILPVAVFVRRPG
jgi:hypothetical protein